MKILFNDIIQKSNAPQDLKSPALSETFNLNGSREIIFDKPRDINSVGFGNCAGNVTAEFYRQEEVIEEIITEEEIIIKEAGEDWETFDLHTYGNAFYAFNKYFVLAPHGDMVTSTDGVNWTLPSNVLGNRGWNCIVFGNNRLVAVGSTGFVSISTDGINWSAPQQLLSGDADIFRWNGIAFGNNRFVAICTKRNLLGGFISTSTDGVNWTAPSRPVAGNNDFDYIIYANNMFVILNRGSSENVFISTSTDGINYTRQQIAVANNTSGIIYGNNIFIIYYYNGNIITSANLQSWTAPKHLGLLFMGGIAYGAGRFIATSGDRHMATSADGVNWTLDTRLLEASGQIVFVNNLFIANYGSMGYSLAVSRRITETNINVSTVTKTEQKLLHKVTLTNPENGLYLLDKKYNNVEKIRLAINGKIGRFAAGVAHNIPTSIAKELTLCSTAEPRTALSGQVIQGLGGYNYKTLSLDTRYKINENIMNDINEAYKYISLGYPFFIDLTDEAYKLPIKKLYAIDTRQQSFGFEAGVKKYLHSRRWNFRECF